MRVLAIVPFLLLFLLGALIPESLPWSLHIVASYPGLYLLFAVITFILFRFKQRSRTKGFLSRSRFISAIISICFFPVFYSLRLRLFEPPSLGAGDSLLLLEHVPVYTHLFGYLDSFDEVLELFVHSKVYLLGSFFSIDVVTSYAIVSSVCGCFFVYATQRFLHRYPTPIQGLGIALLFFRPAIVLFFGYVENYTIVSLLVFITILEGYTQAKISRHSSVVKEGKTLWPLALLAACAATFHLVTGFLFLALLYTIYLRSNSSWKRGLQIGAIASLPAILLMLCVYVIFLNYPGNPIDFTTSFAKRPAIYPLSRLISTRHLIDIIQTLFLSLPLVVFLPLLWFGKSRQVVLNTLKTPKSMFLLLASLGFLFHMIIWNPMIGFPADWDLFTFSSTPLVLLSLRVLSKAGSPKFNAATALFSLCVSISWIAYFATPSDDSRANRMAAQQNVESFLIKMEKDSYYKAIQSIERKKMYVKAMLFYERASKKIANDEPLLKELTGRIREFQQAILLDEKEFTQTMPGIWNSLGAINQRIYTKEQN